MNSNYTGKKLLILGGNSETEYLVNYAKSLGLYIVVIDPNVNSSAKKSANKSYEVDGFDIDGLEKVALKENVDGILVGVADILVAPYFTLCTRLNFPCYATEGAIEYFTNKQGFKFICNSMGIKDINGLIVEDSPTKYSFENLQFPLMIKPIDNGGGVGMKICSSFENLHADINEAMNFSRSKKVIVEEYMDCDDMFAYYTIVDGEPILSAIADRITTKNQGSASPVCIGAIYPSKYAKDFKSKVDSKIVSLIKSLNIKFGVLNIQFFVRDGVFHAYDPGFRLQGEGPHLHVKQITGFDQRKMLIDFALGIKDNLGEASVLNKISNKKAFTLWVLCRAGNIKKISGIDELNKNSIIFSIIQRFKIGDSITSDMIGNERQVFARIYFESINWIDIIESIKFVKSNLEVLDEKDNNMIVEWFNENLLENANT